jgi:5-formyltetrahydrofolate cyclo-ligase
MSKPNLRRVALQRRRAMPPADRDRADRAIAEAAGDFAAGRAGPVCTYAPMIGEPGGRFLLPALLDTGLDVLIPVLRDDRDLDWARAAAGTVPGARLLEPTGERLGPDAVGAAAVVFVPALAVDRRGVRLGRGGGSYDRALARVTAGTPVVALLYDDELVEDLPTEPHDRPVDTVIDSSGPRRCTG